MVLKEGGGIVEGISKYGNPEYATERMVEISKGIRSRREYPEVPFSWIGSLVNGTMGITIDASSAIHSWNNGRWVEAMVKTLSGLGTKILWAELNNLPIRTNEVTVRHDGNRKTKIL